MEHALQELQKQGFQVRTVSTAHLPELQEAIKGRHDRGEFQVAFHLRGKSFPIFIPPTYLYYPNLRAEEILKRILSPGGYQTARTNLPLKLLAARSGLGSYGKNNICYVPGMGSYHRLMAFYSDDPASEDSWQEAGLKLQPRIPEISLLALVKKMLRYPFWTMNFQQGAYVFINDGFGETR